MTHLFVRDIWLGRQRRLLGLTLFAVLSSAGCGGGSKSAPIAGRPGPSPAPTPVLVTTTTTLTVTPATVVVGSPVVLSVAVTASSGTVSGGSVSFSDVTTAAAVLGTVPLDASGKATLSVPGLAAGTHSLLAAYAPTVGSTWLPSGSAPVMVLVAAGAVLPQSKVHLALAGPAGVASGGLLTLRAIVLPDVAGSTVPTGLVTFSDERGSLGTAQLDSSGQAFFNTRKEAGAHVMSLSYAGDATYSTNPGGPAFSIGPVTEYPGGPINALKLNLPGGGTAMSCADPATIKQQISGKNTWYLYCTSDRLTPTDTAPHFISIYESTDLVNWTYDNDALSALPAWANVRGGQLWAPSIQFFNGQYYLYYASPASNGDAKGGAAIGVATSASPKGPFTDHGIVVEPEPTLGDCCGGRDRSTIDPDVQVDVNGQRYISFGSFDGGIFSRKLSADGFTSDKASEIQIAATNRYEGGFIYAQPAQPPLVGTAAWYLFASSANCCNGGLTGYSVFVGRGSSPAGPFLDFSGRAMTDVSPGGDEVLVQDGNRWIGPGGNVVFTDEIGSTWLLFHAIDRANPTYAGNPAYTARPALMSPIRIDLQSAPTAIAPPATATPPPVAQPGQSAALGAFDGIPPDDPGDLIPALSDEFNGTTLSAQWASLHGLPAYTLANGFLNLPTVNLDSCCQMATLPMLVESAPVTEYFVDAKLTMDLPVDGTSASYAQGDLFIYGDDGNFVRLDLYANAGTKQVEFLNQQPATAQTAATSGASNLAGPVLDNGKWTVYLRISKRVVDGESQYTAYSSQDGTHWSRGATWAHTLKNEKIGLAASNRAGYTASFDWVHVSNRYQ